ncbi:MAG: tetratricopeptide repeat protein [Planctomycetes bacterium]|nr:tetratricopeptide repeat protein [Planctomycetota bacterium]
MSSDGIALDRERVVLAFQERYWRDEADGRVRAMLDYIELWPEHEEIVAREFLALVGGSSTESSSAAPGERLGPYLLEVELGRGGQGLVYRAIDTRLGRTVALKILTGLGPGAEKQIARFRREAEVAARLEHPGICGVHDAGIESGVPYIAMRYVKGETLGQRISRTRGAVDAGSPASFLDFSEDDTSRPEAPGSTSVSSSTTAVTVMERSQVDAILGVFEKAARALHAAHTAGIVHRDVKPGNIMIADDGEPVLLDFGLASDDSDDGRSLTMTGDLFGTPAYMSPEQIAGQRIHLDARSDVYSLGVTLFEALTLRRPWEAPTREALYQAIMTKEAPDPRRLNRAISQDLKVLLECALEKDRDRRYSSAAALADDLAALRENRPISARPIGIVGRAWRWSKRRPMKAALIVILAIGIPLVSGLGGFLVTNLDDIREQREANRVAEAEGLLGEGFDAFSEKRYEDGIATFERAIAKDRLITEAVAGIAVCNLYLDRPAEALAAIERNRSRIERPDGLLGLEAAVLENLGRAKESAALEKRAGEPNDALTWFIAGLLDFQHFTNLKAGMANREIADGALWKLRRAAGSSPTMRRAYLLVLATVAASRGENRLAGNVIESIVARWPDDRRAWTLRGVSLAGSDPEAAEASLRRAVELDPTSALSLHYLARFLLGRQRQAEALPLAQEAVAKASGSTRVTAQIGLAQVLDRLGRRDEAETLLRRIAADRPDDPSVVSAVARFLSESGRPEEALEFQERLIASGKATALTYANQALLLQQTGAEAEEVKVWLDRALEFDDRLTNARDSLSEWYSRAGRHDEALALARDLVHEDPTDRRWQEHLGVRARRAGRLDEARSAFEAAAALAPFDRSLQFEVGLFKDGEEDEDAIRARIDALIAKFPVSELERRDTTYLPALIARTVGAAALAPDAELLDRIKSWSEGRADGEATYWNNLAFTHLVLGDRESCIEAARRSNDLDPTNIPATMGFVQTLVDAGRFEEAADVADRARTIAPADAKTWSAYAMTLLRLGRDDEALEAGSEALRLDPLSIDGAQVRIDVLSRVGDFRIAIREARTLVSSHPEDRRALFSLHRLLWRAGRTEESLAVVDELAATPGDEFEVRLRRIEALAELGRFEEAHDLVAGLRELATTMEEQDIARRTGRITLTELVRILCRARGFDEAERTIDEYGELELSESMREGLRSVIADQRHLSDEERALPYAEFQLHVARLAIARGDRRVAYQKYRILLSLEPNRADALNAVAWLRVDPKGSRDLRDPELALSIAIRAVKASGRKDPSILDTLAVAQFACGKIEEAVTTQEEIVELLDGKDHGSYRFEDARSQLQRYRAALAKDEVK